MAVNEILDKMEEDITKEEARRKRIKRAEEIFNRNIDSVIADLDNIPLMEGVDRNSWLFAGCRQDLEKARTRILKYIERVLR
ncbi:hypothetical protein LCGC14_2677690 [marine sediment metagenome]|uniref:Uncharacterized protein n=1 Tax=marine sediment metagenome TaxID=412755 RepID=A0A0F8ZM87_9ZZZZ